MRKILVIFGTRPEAIKMAPVVKALEHSKTLTPIVAVTAQHRELLDQVLSFFQITPDYDLNLMRPNQDLFSVTTDALNGLKSVLEDCKPDCILVHGDTSTTFAGALAAYYMKIPIGHVESGLRTGDKYAPFPEEMNRSMIGPVVDFHFAPTLRAAQNLARENIPAHKVFRTGNTVIDALQLARHKASAEWPVVGLNPNQQFFLMTAHRRENFGMPMERIFKAVKKFCQDHPFIHGLLPVHPNPMVYELAHSMFAGVENFHIVSPLGYPEMVRVMDSAQFILTDSGGIQEEAPGYGKPVLVLRDETERPEVIECGSGKLVGSDEQKIYSSMKSLLNRDSTVYRNMAEASNPFGDGTASFKICSLLEERLSGAFESLPDLAMSSSPGRLSRQIRRAPADGSSLTRD